jgi:membrane protein implicated in regulation of membrane protease activity
MSDAVIYLPFLVIALVAVFAAFSLRGKEIPDWVVGVAAPIAGVVFLFILSESPFGVLFGLALIAIGGVAWYRYLNKRDKKPDPSA